jgi:ribosomal protein L7Ae-like RNA K-turn-binding protein
MYKYLKPLWRNCMQKLMNNEIYQCKDRSKPLQLLGLAKKAGLLAVGSEAVKEASRSRRAMLIISAADASEGSVRRASFNAKTSGAEYTDVPYTKFELGNVTGRGSPGTAAIMDVGLAAEFMKRLAAADSKYYREATERLSNNAKSQAVKRIPKRRTRE